MHPLALEKQWGDKKDDLLLLLSSSNTSFDVFPH
jgi:hypothetical protein